MSKIYIAGPMTGYPDWNFPAFDGLYSLLTQRGWTVISPTDLDRAFEGWVDFPPDDFKPDKETRERFIRRDLEAIMQVDAMIMLRGWPKSIGASAERALAMWRGIPIYYEGIGELPECPI